VDRLKQLCFLTGILLLMVLAVFCIIGSAMGTDWSSRFFASPAGRGLGISLGLLIIAGLFEVKDVWAAKWPLPVYLGALLVITGSLIGCSYTVFAGFVFGSIGLFGLLGIKWNKTDIIIAVTLLVAIVFIFYSRIMSVPGHNLKSVFFVPHIFTSLLSYVFFAQAAFFALKSFFNRASPTEEKSYGYVCKGFPFLTTGIAIGSIWAAFAWNDWWGWDPKETFSLAVWFVFAAFLHFRYLYRQRFLRLNNIWVMCGFLLIVFSVLLVNFSKLFAGLHSYSH
jgi:ABC-type transport system involved in cytochrome c biogenesis permease subunit